jgi:guanine deaminase
MTDGRAQMAKVAQEAMRGVLSGDGGPFGAAIVRNGIVVARAHNTVLRDHDPTAHAEVNAIRLASRLLGRFDLSDCELYTSCEPCPMCYAAARWAKIERIFYGADRRDAADAGFADDALYRELAEGGVGDSVGRDLCLPAFDAWNRKPDRREY